MKKRYCAIALCLAAAAIAVGLFAPRLIWQLEARQRARAIESAAEEKAKKLRTEAEQILYKVQAGYGRLRGDVDATITHASGELGRVDKALEQVRSEFAEHDASLERLLQSCREATRRVPEPVPLKES